LLADFSQGVYRFGQGVLLPGEALHKAAAAQFAARLHAPEDIEQFPPRRQNIFLIQQFTKDNAVTAQQDSRYMFAVLIAISFCGLV
jgi:hypothetical protein